MGKGQGTGLPILGFHRRWSTFRFPFLFFPVPQFPLLVVAGPDIASLIEE
jgi:hypothetical protein